MRPPAPPGSTQGATPAIESAVATPSIASRLVHALLALDAGTTGVRCAAFDADGELLALAYRELAQHYPAPGSVEHDPTEIWRLADAVLGEVAARLGRLGASPLALGITNQRETALAWDRHTGEPLGPAIVWQDRRTASRCAALAAAGCEELVRESTGLLLDPYFSATKWAWMLEHGVPAGASTALGTVDSWVIWNLTGGPQGGRHVTEPSNASRTLCYDLRCARWSEELCALFGVPIDCLPSVEASAGPLGEVAPSVAGGALAGVPVAAALGDQQASLLGHGCIEPGSAKATFGTGTFLLAHAGAAPPAAPHGLVTTVAWDLGPAGGVAYALEGSVFASGAAIQWLRDGLGVIADAAETEPLAASVPSSDGVVVVPAFTGLGSPWWDPAARAAVLGITRGTTRAHVARAVVEALAFQAHDVLDAMAAAGRRVERLSVDGGASTMDLLLQLQADLSGIPVTRAPELEATARGAAIAAGLGAGLFADLEGLPRTDGRGTTFLPSAARPAVLRAHERWRRALVAVQGFGAGSPSDPGPASA